MHPNGWSAVREAVQAGLTKEKDTFFLLHIDNEVVKVCNSEKLRIECGLRRETIGGVQLLLALLDKRDHTKQVFLIDLGGDKDVCVQAVTMHIAPDANQMEVWTRDSWNADQYKKQQQQQQQPSK